MTVLDHINGIFSISFCFWLIYTLYITIRVRLFIIKRYEQETKLSQTKFFRERAPWAPYFPALLRSQFYSSHLWKFVVYWNNDRFAREKKKGTIAIYDDIATPGHIISHFSIKEIKLVKRVAYVLLLLALHGIVFSGFQMIWPETFSSS